MSHEGRWLKRSIESRGETFAAFARRAKVSRDALNKWFNQDSLAIRYSTLVRLVSALGFDWKNLRPGFFYIPSGEGSGRLEEWEVRKLVSAAMRQPSPNSFPRAADANVPSVSGADIFPEIPTWDLTVAAGPWTDVAELGEAASDQQTAFGIFRVRIAGDSMESEYKSGDIVEFRCLRDGADSLDIGEDYYIQREDGLATFKRLEGIKDGSLEFRAVNRKKYPSRIVVSRADIVRMGAAVGIFTAKRSIR